MKRRSADESGVGTMPSRASFEREVPVGDSPADDGYSKFTDKRRGTQSPAAKAKSILMYLLLAFFAILTIALGTGGGSRLAEALGWRRPDRVALLTVATHLTRLADGADSESEYGASKTAFSFPFSVDNKARYCALHQYDLNVDVLTGNGDGSEGDEVDLSEGGQARSSRFRKLALIRQLWRSYDWLIWMDIDALFLDPSVDVLSLLDKSADLHFTLEAGAGGAERVNTGFFAVRTTEFARDFFERAWVVNDCGRGQSDQRSINFVLGKVNADDGAFCAPSAALEEWQALAQRHGGEAAAGGKVRYYKKALLNAFPRDVGKHLVPVERYVLPDALGDETAVSLVVHFAGQFGGARTLDGTLPVGMLVQYLHLLTTYHGAFLDRVSAMEAKAALAAGDHKAFHAFHDEHPAQAKVMARAAALKARTNNLRRHRPHAGASARHRSSAAHSAAGLEPGQDNEGPKTVQDTVWAESGEWTRPHADVRQRLKELEAMLERECLGKMKEFYVDSPTDLVTGHVFKEPPRLAKPRLHGISQLERHAHVNERGEARVDPAKACDYVGTLSKARQHLAELLPDTPAPLARWPRTLLCAAPLASDPSDLAARLNATRLWLEMRRPSTLAKLQFGAPYLEDDEVGSAAANPLDAPWDATELVDEEERRAGGKGGLPLGPSLFASLDVSAPPTDEASDTGGRGAKKGPRKKKKRMDDDRDDEQEEGSESSDSQEEESDAVEASMDDDETSELERGAFDDRLLVAAAECAFLDPAKGVVVEATFAYSANPEAPPGKRAFFEAPSRFATAFDSPAVYPAQGLLAGALHTQAGGGKKAPATGSDALVHDVPGAVFLPPMSARHAEALEHALAPGRGAKGSPNSYDDDGGLLRAYGGFEEALGVLTFWTYTAPLLCRLLAETDEHVVVVVPGSIPGGAFHTTQLLEALEPLHLPPKRILLTGDALSVEKPPSGVAAKSSRAARLHAHHDAKGLGAAVTTLGAGTLVYADLMLTMHSTMPLATVATQQLSTLRTAAMEPARSAYQDPSDDLVICIEEVPLDVPLEGGGAGRGTLVSDWFMVRTALQDALPSDHVATYDARKGFSASDASAVEFFRRAKLIVVAAGVVPSLLLALFSSEGIPVIELVGKPSLQGGGGHALEGSKMDSRGKKKSSSSAKDHFGEGGDHDVGGWAWTQAVLAGLGLERVSVTSTFTDGAGAAVFDPEELAEAAIKALRLEEFNPENTESEGWHDVGQREDLGARGKGMAKSGDDAYKDEVDDHGGRPAEKGKRFGEEEEEGEEENDQDEVEEESSFMALSPEVRGLIAEFSPGKGEHVSAELGLLDRDRFGDLLQRLGDPATAPREGGDSGDDEETEGGNAELGGVLGPFSSLGGAIVGAEHGDFSLQVLRRWTRCPSWLLWDSDLASDASSSRMAMVTKVLAPWLGGRGKAVASVVPSESVSRQVEDGSLAVVYLDGKDKSAEGVVAELERAWPKIAPGGMAAGHDFTRAHGGVAQGVVKWIADRRLTLFVTDVQRPRNDVLGNELPPCCPSWYFFKPLDHDDEGSGEGGSPGGSEIEAAARRIAEEINYPANAD